MKQRMTSNYLWVTVPYISCSSDFDLYLQYYQACIYHTWVNGSLWYYKWPRTIDSLMWTIIHAEEIVAYNSNII